MSPPISKKSSFVIFKNERVATEGGGMHILGIHKLLPKVFSFPFRVLPLRDLPVCWSSLDSCLPVLIYLRVSLSNIC